MFRFLPLVILFQFFYPPAISGVPELPDAITGESFLAQRTCLFNQGWKFFKGDVPEASRQYFDDTMWRNVSLPHDWSIEGPFSGKLASATAYLPCGIGWYRKSFSLPADLKGKHISIRFDGVYKNSEVWCNGRSLGKRPYGYSSFNYDLTPSVHFGASDNLIAVRVDHSDFADSRWYAGSGIYRNVFLTVTGDVHIEPCGTCVTTRKLKDQAEVTIQTSVRNESSVAAEVTVANEIKDPQGKGVGRSEDTGLIPAGGMRDFKSVAIVDQPVLWSPDHPGICRVETVVKSGAVLDQAVTPFGIRSFGFDPDTGFWLNEKNLKLKGVCLHHEAGALGAAVPIQVWERRLRTLQEAGCNAIRTSHNPPAPEFLDLCDRLGFLVMDEAFDEWSRGKRKWVNGHNGGKFSTDGYHSDFEQWAEIDLRDMILRDRNHPSIILWSIGNEIDYRNDPYPPNSPELPPIADRLIKTAKAADSTRPVTAACASIGTNLFANSLDVVGYNYQENRYQADHTNYPARVIYGSENSHKFDAWQSVANTSFICGQFLWTGIDYLGESLVWPNRSAGPGLLDLAGFKKPRFYFRKSLWTAEPMVFISTHALPRDKTPGIQKPAKAPPSVTCFTNCQTVELILDGRSLGENPLPAEHFITWPIDFQKGVLKAIGKNDGVAVCDFTLRTAGKPRKLMIIPDTRILEADGKDLAQIEVDITDLENTIVPEARPLIKCTLSGPGRVIGMESGDPTSHEDYKANTHSAFQGRILIYLQSRRMAGTVTLTVSAANIIPATTSIEVK